MARNLKPKHTMCRRLGEKVCTSLKCPVVKRPYPAGVHGPKATRVKRSEYGKQLLEKQKAKIIYGVLERQFERYFEQADKSEEATDRALLRLLETRLDSVVYLSGLARTRWQARQLTSHGHILVNGRRTDIPSFQVRIGDTISVRRPDKKFFQMLKESAPSQTAPRWLAVDPAALSAKVVDRPADEELPQNIQSKLIVEFYSK